METKKKLKGTCKIFGISMILLLMTTILGCSKNEDERTDSPIKIGNLSFSTNGINNCADGNGTLFNIAIPYVASSGLTIMKVGAEGKASDGTKNEAELSFNDYNNIISVSPCSTFNAATWFDFTFRLTASDGSMSIPATIRVNKPAGAN